MKPSPKIIAPLVVFAVAIAITSVMVLSRPVAESQRPPSIAPPVRVLTVEPADVGIWVMAQGNVEPRTESDLVTEVAGRVVWVSRELASGGFFDDGDVLARIDPRDYEVARDGAQAALARARANLAHAEAGLGRQQSMRQSGASSRALLDDAIHAKATAEADVREAEVAVRRSELDLERAEIRAPFAGRVRTKHVDVGQFVSRGIAVARVYSTDYAEVRLPIDDGDLAHLDLPVRFRGEAEVSPSSEGPRVVLSAEYAGRRLSWEGRVVRTEGALDPRTRMTHIVARVDDPYGRLHDGDRPALPIGLFVDASIEGRLARGWFEIPRAALRQGSEILVVDDQDRLQVRRVDVARADRDRAWLRSGVVRGERVVMSPLEVATEGMAVRVVGRGGGPDVEAEAAAAASSHPGPRS